MWISRRLELLDKNWDLIYSTDSSTSMGIPFFRPPPFSPWGMRTGSCSNSPLFHGSHEVVAPLKSKHLLSPGYEEVASLNVMLNLPVLGGIFRLVFMLVAGSLVNRSGRWFDWLFSPQLSKWIDSYLMALSIECMLAQPRYSYLSSPCFSGTSLG